MLGPLAVLFHVPGGLLWSNVGIFFIYYTQFLLYTRVNGEMMFPVFFVHFLDVTNNLLLSPELYTEIGQEAPLSGE